MGTALAPSEALACPAAPISPATAPRPPPPPPTAPLPHEQQMAAAFREWQAAKWARADKWASGIFSIAFLVMLPRICCTAGGWRQAAAAAAELAVLLAPGLLAAHAADWYLPRRHWLAAAARLVGLVFLNKAMPPLSFEAASGGWRGALRFLATCRVLSLVLYAAMIRLPFKMLLFAHGVGSLEAARVSAGAICLSPGVRQPAAQAQLRGMADFAGALSLLSPTPIAPGFSAMAPSSSWASSSSSGPAGGSSDAEVALCQQVALWSVLCLGWALPLLCVYLQEVWDRRSFAQRHCPRWPRCPSCSRLRSPDMPTLLLSSALLFLALCGAGWQLVVTWGARPLLPALKHAWNGLAVPQFAAPALSASQ